MGAAPAWATSGNVTFLLTDVQGSTKLWEQEPDAMAVALPRHDAIFERLVAAHDGWLVKSKGEGDSVFAVFASPGPALRAALDIQQALLVEAWPTTRPLSVRMSVHSGDAELRDGDWYGPTVNRAARIRATAHGGQVVVSESARSLVGELPEGCTLRDLGERRLKDLTEPERIWQLEHPALPSSFPPLVGLDARPHNLPVQPTPFIGRDEEVAAVRDKLRDPAVRLVTLTGTGGVGKTRLALQAAAECIDDFEHGVWMVALAAVAEERMVALAIADALGVKDDGRPTVRALTEHLAGKQLLLVLDNFEHLLDEATLVADLLASAPGLKVLATSREWLHLRAEHEIEVPPLPVDPAVELFADRAAAVVPGFHVDGEVEDDVRAICLALDGLPLAVELAAARVRRFPVADLRAELSRPLDVATDGARDLPSRQRTLRDTIAWSYRLLDEPERDVLRRLAVFVGGARFDAVEAVCGGDAGAAAHLSSLAEKSLVRVEPGAGGDRRVTVLESVRQFALEELERTGFVAEATRSHADWHEQLAVEGDAHLTGPDQAMWLQRLEEEHGNLRATLDWLRAEPDRALGLAGHLGRFWSVRGHWTEGRQRYAEVLRLDGSDDEARAACLLGAGNLAELQGDVPEAESLLRDGLVVYERAGHVRGMAQCVNKLGDLARRRGDAAAAEEHFQRSLELFEGAGARRETAMMRLKLGLLRLDADDIAAAATWWSEAMPVAEAVGDIRTLGHVANNLGLLALRASDWESAREHLDAAVRAFRELDAPRDLFAPLSNLALVDQQRGDLDAARAHLEEVLTLARSVDDRPRAAEALVSLAALGLRAGDGRDVVDGVLVEARRLAQETGSWATWSRVEGLALVMALRAGEASAIRSAVASCLRAAQAGGDDSGIALHLGNVAELALDDGNAQEAARLLGACRVVAGERPPASLPKHVERARHALGDAATEEAMAEGAEWSVEQAVAAALTVARTAPPPD